jgi:glutathione S-transferase
MALTLYAHPLSSFCQKVFVAFYEHGTPFTMRLVGTGDPAVAAELDQLWPMGKFPVLRDESLGVTIAESSLIIDHIDRHYAGSARLIPEDPDAAMPVHLWDRFFDNYVEHPMQAVVADALRPSDGRDPFGVDQDKAILGKAYAVAEAQLAGREWVATSEFSMADCAAAPGLFYANLILPFADHPNLAAYFARLVARPSFARVIDEARPYHHLFPLGMPSNYP